MYDTFHTFAYYTNDLALSAADVALGTVSDVLLNVNSGGYLMPENWRLFAAYVGIPDATEAYLDSPSLRRLFLPFLDPMSLTALPANNPPIIELGQNGYDLLKTEIVKVVASRGAVAAADAYTLLWAGPRRHAAPVGPVFTMRATSAVVTAEGTWTTGALTFDQTLPPGEFAVVGMSSYGTNLLASRLVLKNTAYRPGILAQGAQGEWNQPVFRNGNFGLFGRFTNYDPPQIDCFGVGATGTQIHYLDIVKL